MGPLPVDFQNHVATGLQLLAHRVLRRAVQVTEHLGVLNELRPLDQLAEFLLGDEVVVPPMLFAFASRPRRVRDGQLDGGIVADQRFDKTGFAGAGRRRFV